MTMPEVIFQTPRGPVPAFLPRLTRDLPDGRVGYFQRSQFDCMRAAVATLLQIDYEQVPDPDHLGPGTYADELDRWARWGEWAASQGHRIRFHNKPPEGADYIALSPAGEDRYRHVLTVLAGHVFDPGSGWMLPVGFELTPTRNVEFVITFERTNP